MNLQKTSLGKLVRYLQSQRTTLMAAGAAKDLIDNLNDLRIYIDQLDAETAQRIFKTTGQREKGRKTAAANVEFGEAEIKNMKIPQIKEVISNESTNKITLLNIAVNRFGEPKGSATKHSRSELIEKISNYISNEIGHESIKRLIKKSDPEN